MREFASNLKPLIVLGPAARIATATGNAIDRVGFDALSFLVTTGDWVDGVHTLVLEESLEGLVYMPAPKSPLTKPLPVVDAVGKGNQALLIGYMGDARYVRMKVEVSGTVSKGAALSVVALLGRARNKPAV